MQDRPRQFRPVLCMGIVNLTACSLTATGFLGVSILLQTNNQHIKIMSYYTQNGNIIVNIGGMQITRDQLDAVKSARTPAQTQIDSDQEAVDYLINIAENAFNQAVQAAEYIADLQTGGDPYEVVHSK